MHQIRYIFGCRHEDRTVYSFTIFERGLKVPIALCKDCSDKDNEVAVLQKNIIKQK